MNFLRRQNPDTQWEENPNEELRFHLEKQMALYITASMSPVEARRQALLEFGGVESVKEECREHRKTLLLETLWADLRYGMRMLRMNPGFNAIVVLTLSLGIGANTAIFGVLDAVVLKPLSYTQSDRLALIWTEMKSSGQSRAPSSGPDLIDICHRAKLLQDAGGIWVGIAMIIDGRAATIVGVMPASFRLTFPVDAGVPPDVQAWVPFGYDLSRAPLDLNHLRVIGRLRPGVTLIQAREELHSIAGQLRAEYPVDSKAGIDFEAFSLQQGTARDTQPAILALFVGVGVLLNPASTSASNMVKRAGIYGVTSYSVVQR